MTNRILDFSESPARLRVRVAQLIIQRDNVPDATIPLADLAVILVAHPQVTYSQAVLAGLATAGGVFVACDGRNLPVGMMLPLVAHYAQAQRFAAQAHAATPVRKRLWQQLVRAKILAQAALLTELHGDDFGLRALVGRVRSGDPSNVEARAAKRYWRHWLNGAGGQWSGARGQKAENPKSAAPNLRPLPSPAPNPPPPGKAFRRDPDGEWPNALLNYGYAVLRAIVARAICAAGLHPSLGIHHHNRSNAFCLADDLIEPFRPTVDRAVAEYISFHPATQELTAAAKQQIIAELTGRYMHDGQQRTLFDVAARLAASLADVYLGNDAKLELPDW
jgi:CRISPR-associated protein Cas1